MESLSVQLYHQLYNEFLLRTLRQDESSVRYSVATQHHFDASSTEDEELINRLLKEKQEAKISNDGCIERYSEAAAAYYSFLEENKISDPVPRKEDGYVPFEETAHLYLRAISKK